MDTLSPEPPKKQGKRFFDIQPPSHYPPSPTSSFAGTNTATRQIPRTVTDPAVNHRCFSVIKHKHFRSLATMEPQPKEWPGQPVSQTVEIINEPAHSFSMGANEMLSFLVPFPLKYMAALSPSISRTVPTPNS